MTASPALLGVTIATAIARFRATIGSSETSISMSYNASIRAQSWLSPLTGLGSKRCTTC